MQRKNYRSEKKRAANELISTLKDPTVIVLSDWLKGECLLDVSCACLGIINIFFSSCSSRDFEELDKAMVCP